MDGFPVAVIVPSAAQGQVRIPSFLHNAAEGNPVKRILHPQNVQPHPRRSPGRGKPPDGAPFRQDAHQAVQAAPDVLPAGGGNKAALFRTQQQHGGPDNRLAPVIAAAAVRI